MPIKIKVIAPKKLNGKAMLKKAMAGIEDTIDDADKEFAKTYATWSRDPEFEKSFWETKRELGGKTETDNEVYRYVNDGTEPHPIPIRKPGPLVFQWGGKGSYRPKTRVRTIGSTSGGPSGPTVVFKTVQHPGTDGRHFDEEIAKKMQPRFRRRMVRAMSEAAKASGHSIRR